MPEQSSASNKNDSSIQAGTTLPLFMARGKRTPLSAKVMNPIVRGVNAFLNLKVLIAPATADADGNSAPSGKMTIADQNSILQLNLLPAGASTLGTANILLGQIVSASTEYVTCTPVEATAEATYAATGAADIKVAKPFYLRSSPFSGAALNLAYSAGQILLILQDPIGGTGVFVSSADVGYIDLNVDARGWVSSVTQELYFDESFPDYIVCLTSPFVTGSPADSDRVRVAKPADLRNSIASEIVDGSTTIVYTYVTTGAFKYVQRTATISGVAIKEVLVARYLKFTSGGNTTRRKILATRLNAGSGLSLDAADTYSITPSTIDFIDITPGRGWAKKRNQT